MKKGVSALIGWVLTIGFTISMAVLIGNFISKSVEEQTKEIVEFTEVGSLCNKLAVDVKSIGVSSSLSGDNILSSIVLSNEGFFNLHGVYIRIFYADGSVWNPPSGKDPFIDIGVLNPGKESSGLDITNLRLVLVKTGTNLAKIPVEDLEIIPVRKNEDGDNKGCTNRKITFSCKDLELLSDKTFLCV